MLYAKIVLGLAVEGPFDYIVPTELSGKIRVGARVWVSFGTRRLIGYVVGLARQTNIKQLKSILELIDEYPVLNKNMLLLTRKISDYYCCSWGEAIETALPEPLRKGKRIPAIEGRNPVKFADKPEVTLIHDLDGWARWGIYFEEIKKTIAVGKSVIILVPDINAVFEIKEKVASSIEAPARVLYRKQPKELDEWCSIKKGEAKVVIGTRSAIFAPLDNLGLVIIDEEQDTVYKQDQVPHYHAREVGLMRVDIDKARLILGSGSLSLESFYLARKNRIKYIQIPRQKDYPEVKINDTSRRPYNSKQKSILSKYLQDSIAASLEAKEKVLLFINRKGFATYSVCSTCGMSLKCPRCSINLVYHSKDNILVCHYCNFKLAPPKICPICESGYIRYLGAGSEKIESEISRLFPQARIKLLDEGAGSGADDVDIFISTESILKAGNFDFGLIGIISLDNSLNRVDFRSSEKTFVLLTGLLRLTAKRIIIQTGLVNHYCIRAIEGKDTNLFYREELKYRKQLGFPPYKHIGLVKLRGNNEEKVIDSSRRLFDGLKAAKKDKTIEAVSVNAGQPVKLRGKYCWQVLLKSSSAQKLSKFLKKNLKGFLHSGIIATVDIDPK